MIFWVFCVVKLRIKILVNLVLVWFILFSKPYVLRFTEKTIFTLVKRSVICSRAEILRNKGILKSLAHKSYWLNSKLCRHVRCGTHYIC